MANTYRVLSIDGGGIRGIVTARLLDIICAHRPNFLDGVDLFAGTSTGSILAIGLAKGMTPSQLVNLYQKQGPIIFHQDFLRSVGSLGGITGARYTTEERLQGIQPSIGNITLQDLLPKHVLISTFQLNGASPGQLPQNWKAKFFHNFEGPDSDGSALAIDVIMRSSAAPTYFPIYQGFVDGGVVANNPSVCALAQAINPGTGNQSLGSVVLMSLGTGTKAEYITSQGGNWGLEEWGLKLVDLLMEAGPDLVDYQCTQLLLERYIRLNPNLQASIGLDAVDQIPALLDAAEAYPIEAALDWIDQRWQ